MDPWRIHGGNQNQSKKVWGINIPTDVEEDVAANKSDDAVSACTLI